MNLHYRIISSTTTESRPWLVQYNIRPRFVLHIALTEFTSHRSMLSKPNSVLSLPSKNFPTSPSTAPLRAYSRTQVPFPTSVSLVPGMRYQHMSIPMFQEVQLPGSSSNRSCRTSLFRERDMAWAACYKAVNSKRRLSRF